MVLMFGTTQRIPNVDNLQARIGSDSHFTNGFPRCIVRWYKSDIKTHVGRMPWWHDLCNNEWLEEGEIM